MNPEIRIRAARTGDLERILSVYREAGISARGNLGAEEAARVFAKIESYPDYTVFVAEDSRNLVGTFALLIMDNLANGGSPSGVVEDVAVAPAAQGKGIGRAMMSYAADRCRERGCYKMTLSSNAERAGAHAFYESLGFTRHGYSFRLDLKPS